MPASTSSHQSTLIDTPPAEAGDLQENIMSTQKAPRRKVISGYKMAFWHTYASVQLECGHSGTAKVPSGSLVNLPKTSACFKCLKMLQEK
jgi:hypothetical protein